MRSQRGKEAMKHILDLSLPLYWIIIGIWAIVFLMCALVWYSWWSDKQLYRRMSFDRLQEYYRVKREAELDDIFRKLEEAQK